jgi:hypothetical protein
MAHSPRSFARCLGAPRYFITAITSVLVESTDAIPSPGRKIAAKEIRGRHDRPASTTSVYSACAFGQEAGTHSRRRRCRRHIHLGLSALFRATRKGSGATRHGAGCAPVATGAATGVVQALEHGRDAGTDGVCEIGLLANRSVRPIHPLYKDFKNSTRSAF